MCLCAVHAIGMRTKIILFSEKKSIGNISKYQDGWSGFLLCVFVGVSISITFM